VLALPVSANPVKQAKNNTKLESSIENPPAIKAPMKTAKPTTKQFIGLIKRNRPTGFTIFGKNLS
jgi:hypothetical protein